ncbi:sigma-70 family RNA polymerase sigma factor [Streptomyces sp. NBC_00234]|uniref:sigma-70 family RNA polymerase sigma factor n=1 Tax=Streptomyces sp. NBC_00234 TaxID=2903638 RepID=UPI002E2D84EA|nr:sigma-70 family RNA polymerase sigma factor [Streptomyces sp. NBC_00234]
MNESRSRTRRGTEPMTQQPPDLSFTAFHQMNRPTYVHYAETFLHNRHDAEEAIDSAFEQLLRTWDKVLLTENPAGYAWILMRNKVTDHGRARNRRPPLLDDEAFNTLALRDAVDPYGQITESLALMRAMRQLTERQLDVMVMTYLHGLKAPEVADALGITSATVRSTVRHATRRLRAILGPDRTMEGRR